MNQNNLKKSIGFLTATLTVTALVAGCASKPSSTGAASGAAGASGSNKPGVTTLRPYREATLANGLRVLFLRDASLPALSMGLLIQAGATSDPDGLSGLANLVSDLLSEGTKKRDANAIADDLGRIGASFGATVDYDYTYLSITGLSFSSNELLSNFAELAMQPSFPENEVNRVKQQTMAQIERALDNPRAVADVASNTFLFGKHPYGRSVLGSIREVEALSKKSVTQHYLRFYRPNNAILTVVGKFDAAFEKAVETEFGQWANREIPKIALDAPQAVPGLRVHVVEKPGLSQAQIRLASLGIRRKDDDFLPLRVANTILGGAFASRLNDRIRKELGLTYSISSGYEARLQRGAFEIETFTKAESIEKVVTETLALYKEFAAKGITAEELERARGFLRGVFPQAIETSEKLAFNLVLLRLFGISDRYLTHYIHDIDDLSVSDINSAIRRHAKADDFSIVVYGPPGTVDVMKKISPQTELTPVDSLK